MKRLWLALGVLLAAAVSIFTNRQGAKHRGAVLDAQTGAVEARKETVNVRAELDKEKIHNVRDKAVERIRQDTNLLVSDIMGSSPADIQRRVDEYARRYDQSGFVPGDGKRPAE